MKAIKKVGFWGLAVAFIAAPFTSGLAVTGDPHAAAKEAIAAARGANPNFIGGGALEYYPLAIDTLGFQSLLVLTNIAETTGSFQICRVPAGTTQFSCTGGIRLAPRQTRIFEMREAEIGLANNIGQIFIFSEQNSIGASILFIFSPGGFTAVAPTILPV
jgi:hypothetical protein